MPVTATPHRHSFGTSILLHIVPGILIAAFGGGISYLLRNRGIPAYFFLEISILVIMVPVMTGLMVRARRLEAVPKLRDVPQKPQRTIKIWEYIVYPAVIVGFSGAIFMLLGEPVNGFFRELLVPNLPAWADVGHAFTEPDSYGRAWRIITWALGIPLVVVVGPTMEEFYFRGYLLPRIPGSPVAVISAGIVLFACYHVFTIWMVPLRLIALIPLVAIVWRTRSVAIGIIGHCALNLIGDTIGSIPAVFG